MFIEYFVLFFWVELKFVKVKMLITQKKEKKFLNYLKKILFLSKFLRQKTQFLMKKLSNYQVKLIFVSCHLGHDILSYNSLNRLPIVSQHVGFLKTINKFFN